MDQLKSQLDKAISRLSSTSDSQEIQDIRVSFLGKNGSITQEMRKLPELPNDQKKDFAKNLNILKSKITDAIDKASERVSREEVEKKLRSESIDVSLPAREQKSGKLHLISHTLDEITEIFGNMGFGIEYGPDIEDEFNNFDALNIAPSHPARQLHDTFYMEKEGGLLRTHTSTVQIRTMSTGTPPFKFISPGRVYRCDSDQTHTPMFHQVEGVFIDHNIDMGHLKGCLKEFLYNFFEGQDIKIRFRPHFFPFTEPSAEVDISMGDSGKWLEVLGCGMVHPNVLKQVDVDPSEYQGFAFGMGVERLAMLKHGISDLRTFFEGNATWSAKHGIDFYRIPKLIWGLGK